MSMQVHNSENEDLFIADREEDAIREATEHAAPRFLVDDRKLEGIRFDSFQGNVRSCKNSTPSPGRSDSYQAIAPSTSASACF
jgi:hypothetical protein